MEHNPEEAEEAKVEPKESKSDKEATSQPLTIGEITEAIGVVLGILLLAFLVGAAMLGIAFLVSNARAGRDDLGVYAALLAVSVGGFVGASRSWSLSPADNDRFVVRLMGAVLLAIYAAVVGVFIVSAGQFFRYWALQFGGFSVPAGTGYWGWAAYAAYWLLDNVFANVGQIFGFEQTTIHPVTLAARIAVFVYNIVLEALVITTIVRLIGWVRRGRM